METSQVFHARLVDCLDYQSFILCWKEGKFKQKPCSYNQIAIRAGFKSRSFPREVANGHKKLTASSLPLMIKGMGLKNDLAEYFKVLVCLQHPEILEVPKSLGQLKRKLSNLRARIQGERSVSVGNDPYEVKYFPFVYAACGTFENGATITQVKQRSGLDDTTLNKTLEHLVNLGVLRKQGIRIFPKESHLVMKELVKSPGFRQHFQHLLDLASKAARADFESQEKLFFTSSFSVKREDVPQLKLELMKTLLQFVDGSEDAEGNKVMSIVCGLV